MAINTQISNTTSVARPQRSAFVEHTQETMTDGAVYGEYKDDVLTKQGRQDSVYMQTP
jgi:hypothetical protein